MSNRLHHVSITTPDMDRCLAFYRDLLAFPVVTEGRMGPALRATEGRG